MQGRLLVWSLRHRRARHVLDAIAIAVTVAVVMVFVALLGNLMKLSERSNAQGYTRILVLPAIVTPGTTTDGHPVSLLGTLQKIEGVKVVQRKRVIFGRHESGASYLVSGEEDSGIDLNKDFFPVSDAEAEAWKRERPLGAIPSEVTARELGLKIGVVTEIPTIAGPLQIKPVAISHHPTFPQSIAVHYEYLQEATKNTQTCGYRVFTSDADAGRVIHEIKERTQNTGTPAHGITSERFRAALARRASALATILGFLGAFLIFTTALTLANNRSISIHERRSEMATLRVIGYRRGAILRLLVGESLVVSLIGGGVAIVVMWFVFRNGLQLTEGQAGLVEPVQMSVFAIACGVLAAIAIPLTGTLVPAIAAARQPVVEGLRDGA